MKWYYALLIVAMVQMLGCQKDPSVLNIKNLNGDTISIFGHSGMGSASTLPTNSFASVRKCLYIGADGTELDVQMTKDSVLIAIHSEKLEESTDCEGLIHDKLWDEIKDCEHAAFFSSNNKLISLEDLFTRLDNARQYTFTFDCKLFTNGDYSKYQKQYINALIRLIDKLGLEDNVFIESRSRDFIASLKYKRPDYKIFFIHDGDFEIALKYAVKENIYGISMNSKDLIRNQVSVAHDSLLRVAIWGLNHQDESIDALEKSPDYIQTDKLTYTLKLFDKYRK